MHPYNYVNINAYVNACYSIILDHLGNFQGNLIRIRVSIRKKNRVSRLKNTSLCLKIEGSDV